jgi:tripartite motif-containing protein 71
MYTIATSRRMFQLRKHLFFQSVNAETKKDGFGFSRCDLLLLSASVVSVCCFSIHLDTVFSLAYLSEDYSSVTHWGSRGSLESQFDKPHGVAVDSSGNVYVADTGNDRIQKFSGNGTFISRWGISCTSYPIQDLPCQNPLNGDFNSPNGIAVDSSGNVYVADTGNDRIQKFSGNGTFISKWGSLCDLSTNIGCNGEPTSFLDRGAGQFLNPTGLAVDSTSGNVYVADYGNDRIQKFTSTGKFLKQWGFEGQLDGYFTAPTSIAVDSISGNVYVADTGNNRIQEFTSAGLFVAKWGSSGSADGLLVGPSGVAVDSNSGKVYIADYGNNRIQVFSRDGVFITKWGSFGFGNFQFAAPRGVAVDSSSGNVFVADILQNRIDLFALASKFSFK